MKNLPNAIAKKHVEMIADYAKVDGYHDVLLKQGYTNGNDGRCILASSIADLNDQLRQSSKIA